MAMPMPNNADVMARRMGFPDAATAQAYYQKQQQMRTAPAPDWSQGASASSGTPQSGGLLDRLFAIHPAIMLGHVLSAWNKATGQQ